MANVDDPTEIPTEFYKSIVNNVAQEENFENYTINVTLASSKGENYLGVIYRIKIAGKRDGELAELNLILKIPLQLPMLREKFPVEKLYKRESYVYKTMLPKLQELQDSFDIPEDEKFIFVKSYEASSEPLKEFIVMEDLRESGFIMAQRRKPLPYDHVKLLLQKLSRYHALTFVLKEMEPETYRDFSSNVGGAEDFTTTEFLDFYYIAVDRCIKVLEDEEMIEKVKACTTNISDKFTYCLDSATVDGYTGLCHGDCWNNNVLFKYKDDQVQDLRLVDWQIVRNTSPISDIAYWISANTDETLRNNHFTELMDFYYETFGKALKHMGYDVKVLYPKEKFDEHLKKVLPYGLMMSFIVLPAVLGDLEDVPDMDNFINKEKADASDFQFQSQAASSRYTTRMRELVKFFVDNKYI